MKNIKNNKGQSLISVMLFVMVLGIIVTLIIASSITDTKRLISQKSYERAYSLADSYLSKILANSGEVFGASTVNLQNTLEKGNEFLACEYKDPTVVDGNLISANKYVKVNFECNAAGPNKDSNISCTQEPVGYGFAMAGVKDKKMKINLDGIGSSSPKLNFMFSNADALMFNLVYTRVIGGAVKYENFMFGVRTSSATGYTGMTVIDNSTAQQGITYPTASNIDTVVDSTVIHAISGTIVDSDLTNSFYDSLPTKSPVFVLDIAKLAEERANSYLATPAPTLTLKSLTVSFLNKDYTNAKYSVVQEGFPTTNHLDTQFQRTSCKALDSAVLSSTSLTAGFGAAELETYRPINKTVAGILDYSLFITAQPGDPQSPTGGATGASINK